MKKLSAPESRNLERLLQKTIASGGWWPNERTFQLAHGIISAWAPELVITRRVRGRKEVLLTRYGGGAKKFRGWWHLPGGYDKWTLPDIAADLQRHRETGAWLRCGLPRHSRRLQVAAERAPLRQAALALRFVRSEEEDRRDSRDAVFPREAPTAQDSSVPSEIHRRTPRRQINFAGFLLRAILIALWLRRSISKRSSTWQNSRVSNSIPPKKRNS